MNNSLTPRDKLSIAKLLTPANGATNGDHTSKYVVIQGVVVV